MSIAVVYSCLRQTHFSTAPGCTIAGHRAYDAEEAFLESFQKVAEARKAARKPQPKYACRNS